MSQPKKVEFSWVGLPVLVTGATGLVGSWLVRRLLEGGADVTAFVVDHDPQSEFYRQEMDARCRVINGALEERHDIERALGLAEPQVVFHLGAQTIVPTAQRFPLATFEANIRGSYQLFESCRALGSSLKALVVASSDKVYGEASEFPTPETAPLNARGPYDVSKACTDQLAQCYAENYSLPIGIARCGNIYGGGDLNFSRIIPGTIRSLLCNEAPRIRSDGSPVRDYFYVEDVALAYLSLASGVIAGHARGKAYNFSNQEPLSVLELVKLVARKMNVNTKPVIEDTAGGEISRQALLSTMANSELGWQARFTLEQGLDHTIEWYRQYFASRGAL